jgi:NAD(P)-dependent dehydrogenase (short-subunit alcohol dehydrogenase family)
MKQINYFKNKTIIITGGASGLGEEIVKQLIPHAKKIHILDILKN